MEKLPVKLITIVADHVDDEALRALTKTSRKVHAGAISAFGKSFFKSLKFYLSEEGLRILAAISTNPELAVHVRNVVFETMHSRVAILGGSLPHGGFLESGMVMFGGVYPMNVHDINQMEAHAATIGAALTQLPNLTSVNFGHHFSVDDKELRSCKGAPAWSSHSQGISYDTPATTSVNGLGPPSAHMPGLSNHFQSSFPVWKIYSIANLALRREDAKLCHVRIGLCLGRDQYTHAEHLRSKWDMKHPMSHRVTNLQLELDPHENRFATLGIQGLVDESPIETLKIRYRQSSMLQVDKIHIMDLRPSRLKQLALRQLGAKTIAYANYFKAIGGQLTALSLIGCSITAGNVPMSMGTTPVEVWSSTIEGLLGCRNLSSLHIDRCQIAHEVERDSSLLPINSMDEEMSLRAE